MTEPPEEEPAAAARVVALDYGKARVGVAISDKNRPTFAIGGRADFRDAFCFATTAPEAVSVLVREFDSQSIVFHVTDIAENWQVSQTNSTQNAVDIKVESF